MESIKYWQWEINTSEQEWQYKFYELKEFSLENGHSSPKGSDSSLGNLVKTQRALFAQEQLSPE